MSSNIESGKDWDICQYPHQLMVCVIEKHLPHFFSAWLKGKSIVIEDSSLERKYKLFVSQLEHSPEILKNSKICLSIGVVNTVWLPDVETPYRECNLIPVIFVENDSGLEIEVFNISTREDRLVGSQLIKHIFGNPFQKTSKRDFPNVVIQLAESYRTGEDCSFALRDSLLECGESELADHFSENFVYMTYPISGLDRVGDIIDPNGIIMPNGQRFRNQHPEGCWAIDTILGRHI
jgi:hypothetical protein